MSQKYELLRLTKQQLPQAIAMIARAFHHDPFSVFVYPDEAKRRRSLPLMFSIALRYTLRYGEITTTPDITGAACWLPPENTTVDIHRLLRIGALTTSLQLGLPELQCGTALVSMGAGRRSTAPWEGHRWHTDTYRAGTCRRLWPAVLP